MSTKKERKKIEAIDVLLTAIINGLQEKKGINIVSMDLRNVQNSVADYFVICSATSDTQADALASSVKKEVWDLLQEHPYSVEGKSNKQWILVDYFNVIVHIFLKDQRNRYGLEELWGDALIVAHDQVAKPKA